MITAILVAKIILDGGASIAFSVGKNWPMALMFFGFSVADVAALWLA